MAAAMMITLMLYIEHCSVMMAGLQSPSIPKKNIRNT